MGYTTLGRRIIFVLLFLSVLLYAEQYDAPEQLFQFSETENSNLGFIREGSGHGPLRLLISDSLIYLLARRDHKVCIFDLVGNIRDTFHLTFCPADISFDSLGRVHVLQNRVQPNFIAVFENGKEVERQKFNPLKNRVFTEITFSANGKRLLLAGGYTYQIVHSGDADILYALGERPGRFRITDSHISHSPNSSDAVFSAETLTGSIAPFKITCLERELLQFHTDDNQGRIYIVGTSVQVDNEGKEYLTRRLLVIKNGTIVAEINGMEAGHSSYDYANHDIAVDPDGNVYLWRTDFNQQRSEILRWRLKN